jgi:putative ABC transport system ATP-binding protein
MKNTMSELQKLIDSYGGDIEALKKDLDALKPPSKKSAKNPTNDTPVLVSVKNLSKSYKSSKSPVVALNNINFDIHIGEIVALTGPSGSGKSTLLNIIAGLDKSSEGVVDVDGTKLSNMNEKQLTSYRNSTLGFVFQFFYLQPFLTLQQNIEVPAMFGNSSKENRSNRAISLAESVGLSDRLTHLPKELSGGQMQRAAIARALVNAPKLILADEPTGNLDSTNAQAIMALFEKIRTEQNTTIIIVTHDKSVAELADRVIELKDGEII